MTPGTSRPAGLCYVETSALLAALLDKDSDAKRALRTAANRVTSGLTIAEARRALIRARNDGRIDAAQAALAARALRTFSRRCALVPVLDEILERAGRPFAIEPLRTLDAIHLATAEFLGEPPPLITILTRDQRVRDNAVAMGYLIA